MILRSLRLRNFRLHADTSIEFDRGISGILGTNGEGKSTVLEGLAWCLYGARALRGSKGGIRWHGAPTRHVAEAEVVFDLGDRTYRIWRSENDAKLYEGDRSAPIAESTSGVDERVPQLLGMDLAQFASTFWCKQKELSTIADMRGEARRRFFLGVMGVSRIIEAQEELRARKNELKQERVGLAAGLGEREPLAHEREQAAIAEGNASNAQGVSEQTERQAAEHLTSAEAVEAATAALAQRHGDLSAERDRAAAACLTAENDFARLKTRLADARTAQQLAEATEKELEVLPTLRSQRNQIADAIARQKQRAQLSAQIIETEKELGATEKLITDARHQLTLYDAGRNAALRTRLATIDFQLAELRKTREGRRAEALARRTEIQKQHATTKRKVEAIRRAGESGACPTCLRALGETFDAVLATLEVELETLESQREAATQEAENAMQPSDEELELLVEREPLNQEQEKLVVASRDADRASQAIDLYSLTLERLDDQLASLRTKLDAFPVEQVAEGTLPPLDQQIAALDRKGRDPTYLEARRLAGQAPEIIEDLKRLSDTLQEHKRAGAECDDALAELATEFDPKQHAANVAATAIARQKHAESREAMTHARAELRAAEDRHRRADAALMRYDRRAAVLSDLDRTIGAYEQADARMSDFRLEQAASIRPEMEALTSGLVAVLTDGRFEACTINDDFEVTLHRNGQEQEVISGGEEDVVALAQRIAVSQMIAERAGHPLSLFVLDEPFGHFDDTRLQNALELIRRLKGTFEQVLIISHLDAVKESVDRAVTVRLDPATGRSGVFVEEAATP